MATDKILVDRQTDGEKCCGECLWFANEPKEYCCLFDQPLGDDYLQRCPACLATPSARELTPEMVEAVKEIVEYRCGYDDAGLEELQDKLRAAFALEVPATEGSWTCGICGARRSGIEPVQDEECGDSCPEHFEEATK